MTHTHTAPLYDQQAFGAGADFVMLGGMFAGHDVRSDIGPIKPSTTHVLTQKRLSVCLHVHPVKSSTTTVLFSCSVSSPHFA